jgi:hypothetical protein
LTPSPRAGEFNLQRLRTAGPSTSTRDTGTGPSTSCADPTGRSSTRTYVGTPTQRAERRRDSCIARCQQLTSRGPPPRGYSRTFAQEHVQQPIAHAKKKREKRGIHYIRVYCLHIGCCRSKSPPYTGSVTTTIRHRCREGNLPHQA